MINARPTRASLRKVERETRKRQRILRSRRQMNAVMKPAAEIAARRAKELATVDTGAIRDSIGVQVNSKGVILFADDPGALTSEYRDRPFIRPSVKQTRARAKRAISHKLEKKLK